MRWLLKNLCQHIVLVDKISMRERHVPFAKIPLLLLADLDCVLCVKTEPAKLFSELEPAAALLLLEMFVNSLIKFKAIQSKFSGTKASRKAMFSLRGIPQRV